MAGCNICGKVHSAFVMNNKLVCLRCDELLFDIEIECDEKELVKQPLQQYLKSAAPTANQKTE